jgi:membrane associated rhomboid family serine protease
MSTLARTGTAQRPLTTRLKTVVGLSVALLAVLWIVEIINLVLGGALDRYGIRPRDVNGLSGILWAPFIHLSVDHLLANSGPFVVLSAIVLLRGVRQFVLVSLFVMLVGGLGAWLIGRPFSVEVGASGVIFGYLGYLLARGMIERSLGAVLTSLLVLMVYGGALWGLLPTQPGVSFEGHISGFASGGLAAWLAHRRPRS